MVVGAVVGAGQVVMMREEGADSAAAVVEPVRVSMAMLAVAVAVVVAALAASPTPYTTP